MTILTQNEYDRLHTQCLEDRCEDLERENMRLNDQLKDISASVNAILHAAEAQNKATGGQTVSLEFVASWLRGLADENGLDWD